MSPICYHKFFYVCTDESKQILLLYHKMLKFVAATEGSSKLDWFIVAYLCLLMVEEFRLPGAARALQPPCTPWEFPGKIIPLSPWELLPHFSHLVK